MASALDGVLWPLTMDLSYTRQGLVHDTPFGALGRRRDPGFVPATLVVARLDPIALLQGGRDATGRPLRTLVEVVSRSRPPEEVWDDDSVGRRRHRMLLDEGSQFVHETLIHLEVADQPLDETAHWTV